MLHKVTGHKVAVVTRAVAAAVAVVDTAAAQVAAAAVVVADSAVAQVAAAVVLRDGMAADEAAIRKFCAERLADFKVPRRVVILTEIPKGATGKLQRIGLAEKLGLGTSV